MKAKGRTSKRTSKSRRRRRKENVLMRYFRQTGAELKKTSWPNRDEATRLTMIVLSATVAMSATLGLVDWLFSWAFSFIVGAITKNV